MILEPSFPLKEGVEMLAIRTRLVSLLTALAVLGTLAGAGRSW